MVVNFNVPSYNISASLALIVPKTVVTLNIPSYESFPSYVLMFIK